MLRAVSIVSDGTRTPAWSRLGSSDTDVVHGEKEDFAFAASQHLPRAGRGSKCRSGSASIRSCLWSRHRSCHTRISPSNAWTPAAASRQHISEDCDHHRRRDRARFQQRTAAAIRIGLTKCQHVVPAFLRHGFSLAPQRGGLTGGADKTARPRPRGAHGGADACPIACDQTMETPAASQWPV
jgi:hypothetical protein